MNEDDVQSLVEDNSTFEFWPMMAYVRNWEMVCSIIFAVASIQTTSLDTFRSSRVQVEWALAMQIGNQVFLVNRLEVILASSCPSLWLTGRGIFFE